MKPIVLVFIFSIGFISCIEAQPVRVNGIKVGLDPVRSLSMFFKEKDPYSSKMFFRSWEASTEIVGPYRTSLVGEVGFVDTHLQPLKATVNYYSKGYYFKTGLDFNLLDIDEKYEFGIGWRFGASSYKEKSTINLEGSYWENTYKNEYPLITKYANWGEILFNHKIRLFYKNHKLNDFWLGLGIRLKMMNNMPASEGGVRSLFIPGYGFYNAFSPGFQCNLSYKFNIKRSVIHELIHKHSNLSHRH